MTRIANCFVGGEKSPIVQIESADNHQDYTRSMIQSAQDQQHPDQASDSDTAAASNEMGPLDGLELQSPVRQMFRARSVFITGASGFIGRVLLEKLLRCYPDIKNIYILMRQKKNQNPYDRLNKQLLNVPIFDKIRSMKNGQELLNKIVVIPGDINDSWLGISDSNLERLFNDPSLSIVFHSAATIKFDEPLKVSVRLNLIATRTVIEICRRLPNLISFCHVSTCYTNSDILDGETFIDEKIYPMQDDPKNLMQLADILEEDLMQSLKKNMIKARPNTYTYTKALAEKYISQEATDLPVTIVRPSIVVASWKDPLPGWVDNINGPTGLLLAIGKGLLRSLYANTSVKAEIIPVDVVVNSMIAAAYYAARAYDKFHPVPRSIGSPNGQHHHGSTTANGDSSSIKGNKSDKGNNNNNDSDIESKSSKKTTFSNDDSRRLTSEKEVQLTCDEALALPKPPIFHVNSGELNPITWGAMENFCMPIIRRYPSCQVLRYPYGTFKTNMWHDLITRLFVHYLPALFLDTLCLLMGKKRQLLSIYYKLHCAIAALSHFTTHNYNFRTANLTKLRAVLTDQTDKDDLFMDVENLDWHEFWDSYVLGCRRYILRESDDSLEQARKSFKKSHYIELAFRAGLVALLMVFAAMILHNYGFILSSSSSCSDAQASSPTDGKPLVSSSDGTCYNQSSPTLGMSNVF